MRFIKFLLVPIAIISILGYTVYHFGIKMASNELVDTITTELENSGEIDAIKQTIEKDPKLMSFIEEAESVDENTLPFQTKEEATKVLVKKVGISELNDIRIQVQNGTASKEEILQDIQSKLSEEEILALKVIAYKELSSN